MSLRVIYRNLVRGLVDDPLGVVEEAEVFVRERGVAFLSEVPLRLPMRRLTAYKDPTQDDVSAFK